MADMDLTNLKPGRHRLRCPECSGTRKNKKDRSLSVQVEHDKALYHCHHCGYSGAQRTKEEQRFVADVIKIELQDGYLFGRGISRSTAAKYDVGGARQYIRAVGKDTDCVVFPYHDMEGMYYGSKYRGIADKGFSCSAPLKDLWRIDLVDLDKSPDIIITEGEIDALSIAECGFDNVVSIPNGANQSSSDDAFPYLWNGREKLDKAKRVILAGDADKVGQGTQEEIARRLGKHRVWRVVWPEGIKDANDALLQGGMDGLKRLVDGAEPWPVSGLYDASHFFEEVKEIHKNGLESGASTGYTLVDEYYTIAPGLLTVVTGVPNSGKSEFVDQIMCNLAERDGWRFALCSFENPPPIHIMKLVAKHLRSNTWEHQIPQDQFDDALDWVQRHFSFLYHADGNLSDLDSILERLRVAVMRYGIRGTVIDPYNYIQRPNTSTETEWISDMLTKIKSFCMAHGVHCFFIAHPTKMPRSEGGTTVIPTGYDISGSAHFFNKADCGISVHREEGVDIVTIKVWKIRFAWHGKKGQVKITYDPSTTTYSDGVSDDVMNITASDESYGYGT